MAKKAVAGLLAALMTVSIMPFGFEAEARQHSDIVGNALTQEQLEMVEFAHNELLSVGLEGFEGAYILPQSDELVNVMVHFHGAPAAVQQMIARADGMMMSLDNAEQTINDEHTAFRNELNSLFAIQAHADEVNAVAYEIIWEYRRALNGVNMRLPANMVEAVSNLPSVRVVRPDVWFDVPEVEMTPMEDFSALMQDNVPSWADPSGNSNARMNMRVNEMHRAGYDGTGVLIAVIDTGVDYTHPTFAGSFPSIEYMIENRWPEGIPATTGIHDQPEFEGYFLGRNFIVDRALTQTIRGYDRSPYDPMETSPRGHESGWSNHGTHVAGTVAGRNTGHTMGIAPGAMMIHYRVLGPGGSHLGSVVRGIEMVWYDRPDVVNLSLGAENHSPTMDASVAVNNMTLSTGTIFVAAAGNSGALLYQLGAPANAAAAIAVGSFDNQSYRVGGDVGLRLIFDDAGGNRIDARSVINTGGIGTVVEYGNTGRLIFDDPYVQITHDQGMQRIVELPMAFTDAGRFTNAGVSIPAHPQPAFGMGIGHQEDFDALFERFEGREDELEGAWVFVRRGYPFTAVLERAYELGFGGVVYASGGPAIQNPTVQMAPTWLPIPNLGIHNAVVGGVPNPSIALRDALRDTYEDGIGYGYVEIYFDDFTRFPLVTSNFSGRGPIRDNFFNIKPDVISHGNGVWSATPWWNTPQNDPNNHNRALVAMQGTSMSAPAIAGSVAILLQFAGEADTPAQNGWRWNWDLQEVRVRLMNSGTQNRWTMNTLDNLVIPTLTATVGVFDHGAGVPDIYAAAHATNVVSVMDDKLNITSWGTVPLRQGSFSFGGMIPGTDRTMTALIENQSDEERTYTVRHVFFGSAGGDLPPITTPGGPGYYPVRNQGTAEMMALRSLTFSTTEITVPANSYGTFDATIHMPYNAVPQVAQTGAVGNFVQGNIIIEHNGAMVAQMPFGAVAVDPGEGLGLVTARLARPVITTNYENASFSGANILTLIYTFDAGFSLDVYFYETDASGNIDLATREFLGVTYHPGIWLANSHPVQLQGDIVAFGWPSPAVNSGNPGEQFTGITGPELDCGDYVLVLYSRRVGTTLQEDPRTQRFEFPFTVHNELPEFMELEISTGVADIDLMLEDLDLLGGDNVTFTLGQWYAAEQLTIAGNVHDLWVDKAAADDTLIEIWGGEFVTDEDTGIITWITTHERAQVSVPENLALFAYVGPIPFAYEMNWEAPTHRGFHNPQPLSSYTFRVPVDADGNFSFSYYMADLYNRNHVQLFLVSGWTPMFRNFFNLWQAEGGANMTWPGHSTFIPGFVQHIGNELNNDLVTAHRMGVVSPGEHAFSGITMAEFAFDINIETPFVSDIRLGEYVDGTWQDIEDWMLIRPLPLPNYTYLDTEYDYFNFAVNWEVIGFTSDGNVVGGNQQHELAAVFQDAMERHLAAEAQMDSAYRIILEDGFDTFDAGMFVCIETDEAAAGIVSLADINSEDAQMAAVYEIDGATITLSAANVLRVFEQTGELRIRATIEDAYRIDDIIPIDLVRYFDITFGELVPQFLEVGSGIWRPMISGFTGARNASVTAVNDYRDVPTSTAPPAALNGFRATVSNFSPITVGINDFEADYRWIMNFYISGENIYYLTDGASDTMFYDRLNGLHGRGHVWSPAFIMPFVGRTQSSEPDMAPIAVDIAATHRLPQGIYTLSFHIPNHSGPDIFGELGQFVVTWDRPEVEVDHAGLLGGRATVPFGRNDDYVAVEGSMNIPALDLAIDAGLRALRWQPGGASYTVLHEHLMVSMDYDRTFLRLSPNAAFANAVIPEDVTINSQTGDFAFDVPITDAMRTGAAAQRNRSIFVSDGYGFGVQRSTGFLGMVPVFWNQPRVVTSNRSLATDIYLQRADVPMFAADAVTEITLPRGEALDVPFVFDDFTTFAGGNFEVTLDNAPAGITWNAATNNLVIADTAPFGTHTVTIIATNDLGYATHTIVITVIETRIVTLSLFNNGPTGTPSTPNPSFAEAGRIRMWAQLDGVNTPISLSAADTIVALDHNGNCAVEAGFITVNRMWQAGIGWLDQFNFIDVTKNGAWQYINFSITAYGQTVEVLLCNSRYFHVTVFDEDWRDTINVWFFQGIPLHTNGLEVYVDNMVAIVDGEEADIKDFTVNIADWQTHVGAVMINKDLPWQEMTITFTAFNQSITKTFVNNMYVPVLPPVPSFDIFNNGPGGTPSRPNPSLAANGVIRMWTQLDDVNAPFYFAAADTIVALDQNNDCAMDFVHVRRVWQAGTGWLNYFTGIDVDKNQPWQYINLSITVFGQEVEVLLVNALFKEPAEDVTITFVVEAGAASVYAETTTTVLVSAGEAIPADAIPSTDARTGFYFAGWYPSDPAEFGPVTEAITFTARFNPLFHYVTFETGVGGQLVAASGFSLVVSIRDGFAFWPDRVPTPVADAGYVFIGWYPTDPAGFVVRDSMTFTAVFEMDTPLAPKIISVTPNPAVVERGNTVEIIVTTLGIPDGAWVDMNVWRPDLSIVGGPRFYIVDNQAIITVAAAEDASPGNDGFSVAARTTGDWGSIVLISSYAFVIEIV